MKDFWNIYFFRVIAYFNIITVAVIMLDYSFSIKDNEVKIYKELNKERVTSHSRLGVSHTLRPYINTIDDERFYIDEYSSINEYLHPTDTFYVHKTSLFKRDRSISFKYQNNILTENISMFGIFMILLYLIPCLLSFIFLYFQENSIFQGILGLSTVLIISITYVYLFLY